MGKELAKNQIEVSKIESDIKFNFPDFQINDIQKLGEGWMNQAVIVNSEYVFRFPKTNSAAEDLQKEINILPKLIKYISLKIPNFEYIGKQNDTGFPFVGYKIINGILMNDDMFLNEPFPNKGNIVHQIAQFIKEMRTFPVEEARKHGVPENIFYEDYSETFEEVKNIIFPIIDNETKGFIVKEYQNYFQNKENFSYTPSLIHADLSPDHFVYNSNEDKLVGIIDFGDMEIGDPDYEYNYLYEDCGIHFTRKVMELVGEENIDNRLKKIGFFALCDNIGSLLEYIRIGDKDLIEKEIEIIKIKGKGER